MMARPIEKYLPAYACPECKAKSLWAEMRIVAKPLGSHSLSGNHLKVSANVTYWVKCHSCDWGTQAKPMTVGDHDPEA